MPDSTDAVLAELFPPGVAICFSTELPADATLMAAETTATASMVEKRLQEFTHGRYCARLALQKLGVGMAAIPKAADRAPVWPAGIVGTISHSGPVAAAAVAHSAQLAGLGLDIEPKLPLTADVIQMVCRPDEIPADDSESKLYFCLKEAIYKCIYPLIEMYVDFQEMEVSINKADHEFRAIAHSDRFDTSVVENLQGKYVINEELVFAAAWIRRPG
jgi:4'-phosphopantetheinyl transferase EntD